MLENKAFYTTALISCGWAGVLMQVRSLFSVILHRPTDRQSERPPWIYESGHKPMSCATNYKLRHESKIKPTSRATSLRVTPQAHKLRHELKSHATILQVAPQAYKSQ